MDEQTSPQTKVVEDESLIPPIQAPRKIFYFFEETGFLKDRAEYSLWLFHPENK